MKMKVWFYLLAVVLIVLPSCSSQEEPVEAAIAGQLVPVNLRIALEDTPLSRVTENDENIPGKGNYINSVEYAIFDAKGVLVKSSDAANDPKPESDAIDHGHYTLKVNLRTGFEYTFYFWASGADENYKPYTFDPQTKKVKINYGGNSENGYSFTASDERNDAFFGKVTYKIEDNKKYTVILKRPFAQLNILASDIDEIQQRTGTEISSVSVEIKQNAGKYSYLDLYNNNKFACATDPVEGTLHHTVSYNSWSDLVHAGTGDAKDYYYLATCYLPTGIATDSKGKVDKETTDLGITINYKNGRNHVISLTGVPIQRNYRTNIYGALLTTQATVDVRIDFSFDKKSDNSDNIDFNTITPNTPDSGGEETPGGGGGDTID